MQQNRFSPSIIAGKNTQANLLLATTYPLAEGEIAWATDTNQLFIGNDPATGGSFLRVPTADANGKVYLSVIYPSADSTTAIQINKADGTTNVLNVDTTNGRVGIGTTAPLRILGIGGLVARNIGMERGTVADTAGFALTVNAGGATSAATDKAGGVLYLDGGVSTGTGVSAIELRTCPAGSTGTADNAVATMVKVSGNTLGFYGVTSVVRPTALTPAGTYTLNTGDAGSDTEITLMRTRINELETKLQSLGLLT